MTAVPVDLVGDYWADTVDDPWRAIGLGSGKEGSLDDPPRFKCYPAAIAHPLPPADSGRLGSLRDAFGLSLGTPIPSWLPDLLRHANGLARVDFGPVTGWPYHRFVASARCFSPTEVYAWLPVAADGVPAGIHHYDAAHHTLVTLREAVPADALGDPLGRSLGPALGAVIVTTRLWKAAFKYRHYAYRLCCQEAGQVLGNIEVVAAGLGLRTETWTQFLDEPLDTLLRLDAPEEGTLGVVLLYAGADRSWEAPVRHPVLPALPLPEVADVPHDRGLASRAYRVAAAGVARSTEDVHRTQEVLPPSPLGPGADVPLGAILCGRDSGGTLFRMRPTVAPGFVLDNLHAGLWAPVVSDGALPDGCRAGIWARHVEGRGGLFWSTATGLVRTETEPTDDDLADCVRRAPVPQADRVVLVLWLQVDRRLYDERWGPRGYRTAHLDAGRLAQRASLLLAAAGLSARILNGFESHTVATMLGADPAWHTLYQVLVGRRAYGAACEIPLRSR